MPEKQAVQTVHIDCNFALAPASKRLGDAIEEVPAAKTAARLTPDYVRSLHQHLGQFARDRQDMPLGAIRLFPWIYRVRRW